MLVDTGSLATIVRPDVVSDSFSHYGKDTDGDWRTGPHGGGGSGDTGLNSLMVHNAAITSNKMTLHLASKDATKVKSTLLLILHTVQPHSFPTGQSHAKQKVVAVREVWKMNCTDPQ